MNEQLRRARALGTALAWAALAGCGAGGGTVSGTIAKAEDNCALPKTALSHGLAYVDTSMVEHGMAPKVEIILSDRSLSAIDIEQGFNPLFGKEAGAKQLFVLISVPMHGLLADEISFVHPEKSCVTNISGRDVDLTLSAYTPERVAIQVTQPPPAEGAEGARDEAVFTLDLPIAWPKSAAPAVREQMAAEQAARKRFESEAIATYQELVKAVAAGDVASVEQRVSTDGWTFGALLEEMVFGAPDAREEAAKVLPVVAALKAESWVYTREASKADVDWELLLGLCDPADAAKRGTAHLKRQPDGSWRVSDLGDADDAVTQFGPAPAACTALAPPPAA